MCIEDSVEAFRFVLVTPHAVFDVLRSVSGEVIGLSLHWAYSCIQEEELESGQ
jgi:hypothetical protein